MDLEEAFFTSNMSLKDGTIMGTRMINVVPVIGIEFGHMSATNTPIDSTNLYGHVFFI